MVAAATAAVGAAGGAVIPPGGGGRGVRAGGEELGEGPAGSVEWALATVVGGEGGGSDDGVAVPVAEGAEGEGDGVADVERLDGAVEEVGDGAVGGRFGQQAGVVLAKEGAELLLAHDE